MKLITKAIALFLIFLASNAFGQTGYYRSNVGTGTWSSPASWEYSPDNVSWAAIGAEGYPGELGIPTRVTVRNGHTITINVSPANALAELLVGDGASGVLRFGNDATVRSLAVNGLFQVAAGALVDVNGAAFHNLSVGGDFTINGTFDGYVSASQRLNVTLTGTSGTLGGSGSIEFNTITVNRTATTTASANFMVQDSFVSSNSGTFNLGTQVMSAPSGSNTFNMTSGVFQIGGTNTFPAGFETTSLTGGTISYNGNANQTIAHLNGSGNPLVYNNLLLETGGTKSAGGALFINGTIDYYRPINMGAFIHTIGGNWIQRGTQLHTTTGTVIMNGGGFQQINNPVNGTVIQFNNLIADGSGVVSIGVGSTIQVAEDLTVTGNTSMTSASEIRVARNYVVNAGSNLTMSAGNLVFNGSGAQDINVANTDVVNVQFQNGAPAIKTITGNLTVSNQIFVWSTAMVNDAVAGQEHTMTSLRLEGSAGFSGTLYISGAIFNNTAPNMMSLPNASIVITGNASINAGHSLSIGGDFTIDTGYLVVNNGSALTNSGGGAFVMNASTNLYLRGSNSYPTGFTSYTIDPTTTTHYDVNMVQTVRGNLTLGRLRLAGGSLKTIDGPLNLMWRLDLANSVVTNFGAHTHTIHERIVNAGSSSFSSSGTVNLVLKDIGANYNMFDVGSYTFNNLNIDTQDMFATRVFSMQSNLTVNGNLNMQNSAGNSIILAAISMTTFTISNDFGDNWTIGDWIELRTAGSNTLRNSVNTFASVSASANSTVWYNGAVNQEIAENIAPYGNLHLSGTGNRTAMGALDINGNFEDRGGAHTFVAGNHTHTVAGNWSYRSDKFSSGVNGIIQFDGTSQFISASGGGLVGFNIVTFAGTGTKTLANNYTVARDVNINVGVTVDASSNDVDITIGRHWVNNGSFVQINGTTLFSGTLGNQNITSTPSSYFGNVDINKPSGVRTVTQLSAVRVSRQLRVFEDNTYITGVHNISVGRNFRVEATGGWTQNPASTLILDGNDVQNIVLLQPITVTNVLFLDNGTKINSNAGGTEPLRTSGNVEIGSGATFNAQNRLIEVGGNWTNNGTFLHTSTLTFNGTAQTINTSSFNGVTFAGSGTKTLAGGITTNANLTVEPGVTLDVGTSNHAVTVGLSMTINGTFNARNGLVTFNGNNGTLNSGGNAFWNLNFTKNPGQRITLQDELIVLNNLTISNGELRTGANNVTVAGSFTNNSSFDHNNAASTLTFNGTSGSHTILSSLSNFRNLVINAPGATYQLGGDLTFINNHTLTVSDGTLNLNSFIVTLGGTGNVSMSGGILFVNENARLRIPNNQSITNNGGSFRVIGTPGQPAIIERNGGVGGYTITQNSGSFHARYYEIRNTNGAGLTINGGTIDPTNNFSNGTFNLGAGTQYLNLTGYDFADFTVANVIFSTGPTYNVTRLSGAGVITFQDASGVFAGEAFENDGSNLIDWTFPAGITWTGLGDGVSWADQFNWTGNAVPNNASNVILDNSSVVGAYTVTIDSDDATVNRLTMESAGPAIGLTITSDFDITVATNVQASANTTITMNSAGSVFSVAESFATLGVLNFSDGTLNFNGVSGSYIIRTNGHPLHNVSMDAGTAIYTLTGPLVINGNVDLQNGTLNTSTNNYAITVNGNWNNVGLSTFTPNSSLVTMNRGGTTTQSLQGGPFFNLTLANGSGVGTATKELTANIQIINDLIIAANTIFDAQTYNVLVGRHWTNNASTGGFVQTGTGTVFFNGAGNQNMDNGSFATTFNNLEFNGGGTVFLLNNSNVNGNIQVSFGVGAFDLNTFTLTGVGPSNNLIVAGGSTLRIRANNFPSTFENISLASNSTVEYISNINADIYPITYGNLNVRRANVGNLQTKRAIGDLVVQGTLIINDIDTEFDLNGYSLTLTGGLGYPVGGRPIVWADGTFIHNGGDFNINANILEIPNVVFTGSGTKRILTNTNITGNLTIQSPVIFRMDENTLTATGVGPQTLSINNGAELRNTIPTGTGVAFPTGFDVYNLGDQSIVRLNGDMAQTLASNVVYGNLILSGGSTVTLNGNTEIEGEVNTTNVTLLDGGFDLTLGGELIRINDYTPTPGTTITLDGTTQLYRNESGTDLNFAQLVISGTGIKTIGDGNDVVVIDDNLTIQSGSEFLSGRNITFNGATFLNQGIFNHTANTFTFNRAGAQSINPGADHQFNVVVFGNGGTKTFTDFGANLTNSITVNAATTLDFGALSHTLGYTGANFTITGSVLSSAASFTLTGVTPQFPGLTVSNLTINTTNSVPLLGALTVSNNLTINTGGLDVTTSNYALNVGNNFLNSAAFNARNGVVTFNGTTSPVQIQTNGANFYDLILNPGAPVSYTLESPTNGVNRTMTIQSNATLSVNGNNLTLGSAIAAGKTYTINGGFIIPAFSTVTMNNATSATSIVVNGTFSIVGSALNLATLTSINHANTRRTAFTVGATGGIAARHYIIEFLDNNGLTLNNASTVDPVNNFSDGSFLNIVTAAGGPYYYLRTNQAVMPSPINNVSFGFAGIPTPGVHYNVERNAVAAVMTFDGAITGDLAGEAYESDPGNRINWPVPTGSTWTGAFNSDWHVAANWSSNSVPVITTDVTIPLVANNPIISAADAVCKDLTITNGALTLGSTRDLTVSGSITIGTATNAGALVVTSADSEIFVAGGWTRGTNGIFNNGNSRVVFNALSGTVSITPRTSAFHDLEFNGPATFNIIGNALTVNRHLRIQDGTLNPTTGGYNINVAGSYEVNGGTFDTGTAGAITLNGAAQNVVNGVFRNLSVAGTAVKTFNGATTVVGTLTVSSTLQTTPGADFTIGGNVTINNGAVFNDSGDGNHTFTGANWSTVGSGLYSGGGTVNASGGNQTFGASQFYNLQLNGTGIKSLAGNMSVGGDLSLGSTFTRLDVSTFLITGSGGTMSVAGNQTIWVLGADNFPTGFGSYAMDPASITEYRATSAQTIRGGVTYGILTARNPNTKTLGGNIIVQGNLNFTDATIDVSASNYSIFVGGNWVNNADGSFVPRVGEVVFNGTGNQEIQINLVGAKAFYKMTVDKTSGYVRFNNQNHTIQNNLVVSEGLLTINGGAISVTVGGSIEVIAGSIGNVGTYILNSSSGVESLRFNGSTLQNLTIDAPGTVYTLQDEVSVDASFLLNAGEFNGNGNHVNLGTGAASILTIGGVYRVGPNGTMAIGNTSNLTVLSTGTIYVVGAPGQPATVTRRTAGTYGFQVNGTIHARHYVFERMNAAGINVGVSATINGTNNFSDGTFTNGTAGGTFLRIENTQSLTINNVNFPTNPGGSAFNVTKITSTSGVLTFDNASGVFAGELYDDDPNDLISWPTPIVLTWIGAVNTNWYTVGNWSASAGPAMVPTGVENVVIASAVNQPVINVSGAQTNNLTINNGASVTISTPDAVGDDLTINGNLTLTGTLTQVSANDNIVIRGSWTRNPSGVLNNGNSIITFASPAGSLNINHGASSFYNLRIEATASYILQSALNVANNLEIITGTIDVSAGNFAVTVGNNWTNSGSFNPRNGTVTFNRSAAGTVNIASGGSSFYNVNINGGVSTVFQLTGSHATIINNLNIISSTLNLNGLNLTFGDNVGTDVITVSGTMQIPANSQLRMGNGGVLQVETGGTFSAIGSDDLNLARVIRQSSGNYSISVSSGATIAARFYEFSHLNANGLQVNAGATISAAPNNFSDGTFNNGTPGGRFLSVQGITVNQVISNVAFNAGPAVNVRGTSGTGNYLEFVDASGVLAGASFEDDDGNALTGAVRWSSTSTIYTWTGAVNSNWHNNANWDDGIGTPPTPPDATVFVIIPNVATAPIISTSDGEANEVTIQVGGNLTINTNRSLNITSNFTNAGTLTIPNGSTSTLSIGNNIANTGTLSLGNASTVTMTSASGVKTLAFGGSSPHHLTLDGASTFNLAAALVVNGNLTISSGTLDVTASNFQLSVRGNWVNNGTFVPRTGRVIFDGTGAQNINSGGLAIAKQFYNLRIAKSNTATLASDLFIQNNFELNSGSINLGANTIEVRANWTNTAVTVTPATSTVRFSGNITSLLSGNNQPFNNLIVDKGVTFQVNLSSNTTINGNLTVSSGTLFLNGRNLNFGDGADEITVSGNVHVDAGATLFMHNASNALINASGTMRVTGNNASNRARVSGIASTAGWNMLVNGTLRARFATFEYSGADGITLSPTATLHATDNLSDTRFSFGTGNAYITLNRNISATWNNMELNVGPTYNISASTGAIQMNNYSGTLAGARFEDDPGVHPGHIRWRFRQSLPITGPGTYNFRNEVIVVITANAGLTNLDIELFDELYDFNYNMLPRYYRFIYTGGTATANVTFAYAPNEVGTMNEANIRAWRHRGELEWASLTGALNVGNRTFTVTGLTLGLGSITGEKGEGMDEVLDGGEDFLISDATDQSALPVELTRFEITRNQRIGLTNLEWETETEVNNYGFNLYRSFLGFSDNPAQIPAVSDTSWTHIGFIRGHDTTTEKTIYTYQDDGVQEAGAYVFRLEQIDFDGATKLYGPYEFFYSGPETFTLKQNYPNPFNPSTTIAYDVAKRSKVRLEVFNTIGQKVQTLVNEEVNPGSYRVEFNGMRLASGMYIVRYSVDGKNFVKKMMLVK